MNFIDNYQKSHINTIYNVGIYLRLSKEDEGTSQSESIENQKEYITSYILNQGWNIINIYTDDGYTGLNFDRPAFKKMIADIETKIINLVITKDLSRLGRDYIDTGYYLERYFPQKNIRYIALSDGIDTFSKSANNDLSPFKAVINDMYAKDISKKIRAVMDTKRINGKFIGAFAPYGYAKDSKNKNKLIIDPEPAIIIKRIFNSYIDGISMSKIVKILNEEKVLTPTQYKNDIQNSSYVNVNTKKGLWTQETIKRILTNPTYKGDMAQHRSEKINYKVNKFKKIPPKDWIIAENTHEPIIDKEAFNLVQELIDKRIIHYTQPEKAIHLLSGLIYCGDCGQPMTFRRGQRTNKEFFIICSGYSRFGKDYCKRNFIYEEAINTYVLNELRTLSKKLLDETDLIEFEKMELNTSYDTVEKEKSKINKRFDEIKKIIKSLYEDKVRGIISEDDFLQMSQEYSQEKETLNTRFESLIKKQEKENRSLSDTMKLIKQIVSFENPEKNLLSQLISKITIFKNKDIIINYTFNNPYIEE